ncbi:MAG: hypothetical protein GY940_02315 [bacterium]|nr:hypothetical protein [bacterium]
MTQRKPILGNPGDPLIFHQLKTAGIISIMLLLLILSINCSGGSTSIETQEIELHNKIFPLTLTKEKEYRFDVVSKNSPMISKVDDGEHLYLLYLGSQNKNSEVFKITTDFEIKGRYLIKYGIGPGEAQNPRLYGGDKRSIIIYDAPGAKFIEFDANFNLIGQYKLNHIGTFLYSGAWYVPGKRMILDGFYQAQSSFKGFTRIYLRKLMGGRKVEDVKIFETPRLKRRQDHQYLLGEPVHFGYFYDHIYVLDKRNYQLTKMDSDGNPLIRKKVSFKSKEFDKDRRKKWVRQVFRKERHIRGMDFPEKLWPACWLFPITGGIAVAKCENYDHDVKGPIPADYFDKDLNYLGRITLPYFDSWNDPGHGQRALNMFILYRNSKLYIIEERDEERWIVRWHVEGQG